MIIACPLIFGLELCISRAHDDISEGVTNLLNIHLITLRKSHLRKSYLVGLSEVGLPESISHQKVPPQLLCIICTVFALLDSFEPARYSK